MGTSAAIRRGSAIVPSRLGTHGSRVAVLSLVFAVASIGLALSGAPAAAAAADLDPTFGWGGSTVTPADYPAAATGFVRQGDGKLVVVGSGANPHGAEGDFALARFTTDGQLDPSFGQGGRVWTDFGDRESADAVAVQSDGKIVAAGTGGTRSLSDFDNKILVARYLADGSLDPSFGAGGKSTLEAPFYVFMKATTIQPDGKILVGGWVTLGSNVYMLVRRLNSDGSPDLSFGQDGRAEVFGGYLQGFAIQSDGGILIGDSAFSLSRLTANGRRDDSFGVSGRANLAPGAGSAEAMVVQADGRIVLAGSVDPSGTLGSPPQLVLVRYRPDGVLDANFGVAGKTIITAGDSRHAYISALAQAPDGTLIAAGLSAGGPSIERYIPDRIFMTRIQPTGAIDRGFGAGGFGFYDRLQDRPYSPSGLLVEPGGRIVMAGTTVQSYDAPYGIARMFLARFQGFDPGRTPSAAGFNFFGQLGTGAHTDSAVAVPVHSLAGVFSLTAGLEHSLALRGDGTVWAWGWNAFGQLGDNSTVDRPGPVRVAGLDHVVAVAGGGTHSLALRSDGTVWAWGWNGLGQLGTGTSTDSHVAVQVPGLSGVKAIAAGLYHSLALRSDGTVWAWGWNAVGQLGTGTTTDSHLAVQVPLISGATAIAAGALHSLLVDKNSAVQAWGWNGLGQLGDGSTLDRRVPSPAVGMTGAVSVAAGGYHSLAVTGNGTVRAWGWNHFGQLGDGTTTDRWTPTTVAAAIGTARSVAAGYLHTLTIGGDGSVWSWGWNAYGQLATGGVADAHAPARVPGLPGAQVGSAGAAHILVG